MGRDKHGNSGGWSATGKMQNNGTSAASHLQVNFLAQEQNPTPSKNYTVQFSLGPIKRLLLEQTFSVAPGGTLLTIANDVTAQFSLGTVVSIALSNIQVLIYRTIISAPVFAAGNTTFNISSAIDAVTVRGLVAPSTGGGEILTNVPVNAIAEIKWSVEGNDVRRLVSVVSGMSVTGVGEGIKVSVVDRSTILNPGNGVPYAPVNYDVDITCAPGSRASVTQPPTLTAQNPTDLTYSFITTGIANAFVSVPSDAGVISAYVTAFSDGNILTDADVSVSQLNGALINRVTAPNTGWIPLVAGTSTLKLNNLSAHTILWSVTFGIDG